MTFFFPPVTGPEAAPFHSSFPHEFPASCLVLVPWLRARPPLRQADGGEGDRALEPKALTLQKTPRFKCSLLPPSGSLYTSALAAGFESPPATPESPAVPPEPEIAGVSPGENARSWEALGEARPGQSSLSAGALRYRAWAQSWSSAALAARSVRTLSCSMWDLVP